MFAETFHLDQIKNDRLSAIINFIMSDTGQTVPDSYTISIEQNEKSFEKSR